MDLKIDLYIHGVPQGQDIWGPKEEDQLFIKTFYGPKWDVPEVMQIDVKTFGGTQYCYYSFIKSHNVCDSNGRTGSYFAITLRINAFYCDVLNIYNILKATYEKMYVGKLVQDTGDSIKYLTPDFQSKDSDLKKIKTNVIDYIYKFSNNNDLIGLSGLAPSAKTGYINLYDCTKKTATDYMQKAGKLMVSPCYPTSTFKVEINRLKAEVTKVKELSQKEVESIKQQTQQTIKSNEEKCRQEIGRQKKECEQKINALEQNHATALKNKNSELSSMQQLCKDKEDELKVKNQKVQSLKDEIDRLNDDRKNAEQELQKTKQEKGECERNINELRERLKNKDSEISSLKEQCKELNNKIAELHNVKEEEKGIQENVCEPKINEPEQSYATVLNDDSMQQQCKKPKTENKEVQNLEMEVGAQNQEQEPQKTEQVKDECEHNIGEHNQKHVNIHGKNLKELIDNKKQKKTDAQTDNRPNNPNNQRPTEEQPYQPSNTNLNNSDDFAGSNDKPDNEEGKDCEGGNGKKKGLLERIKNFFKQLLKLKPKTRNAASQMPEKNSTKQ